jgi:two-component system LytT family response regulator
VDDEPLAREGLRTLAEQDPALTVVGECGDGRSAAGLIARARPDLVLLDVEMPEMNGFEIIREVGVDRMPFVVFITAYDRFAVQAFEVSAVDYIVKPFTDGRFQQSMERVKQAVRARDRQLLEARLSRLLRLAPASGETASAGQLAIRAPGKTLFVPFGEITWIEADGAYSRVHFQSGKPHVVRETLADLHPRLDPAIFLRAHRSAIVNRSFVREIQTLGRAEYSLVLTDGQRVPLSRRRREAVEESLTGLPRKGD